MKSSLAIIEQTAETALQRPSRLETRTVAGFEVTTEVPFVNTRSSSGYKADAAQLRERLATFGIEPLAVLPKSWWETIIRKTNLVDFNPDDKGEVIAHTLKHARAVQRSPAGVVMYGCVVAALVALLYVGERLLFDLPLLSLLGGAILCGMLLLACALAGFVTASQLWNTVRVKLYVASKGGENAILPSLFGQQSYETYTSMRVGVMLPTPPADVTAILLKADKNFHMRVAAVPEAVALAQPVSKLIEAGWRERSLKEAAARRAAFWEAMADPIVYVNHLSAVAIIAQFGDFPIEQEIVEAVVQNPF